MSTSTIPRSLRRRVYERAGGRCEYCRISDAFHSGTFHCDHCVPERAGGATRDANLALACPRCNGSKLGATTARDPESGEEVALFNPRTSAWAEHFAWSADRVQIIGTTPCGRATVMRLGLNHPKRVELRARLAQLGLDP